MTDDAQAAALKAVEQQLGSLGASKKSVPRTLSAEAFNAADHFEWVGKQALEEATTFYEFCHRLAAEMRREAEGYARRTVSAKFFNGGGEPT